MKPPARVLLLMLAFGVGLSALAGGCGANVAPSGPATVRGKVSFNGRPVAGGLVVFAPNPERGGRGKPARGETGPDGSFQLELDKSAQIPAGWYRVALTAAPAIPDPLAPAATFPAKLARPDRSGIEREVRAGTDHVFEFAVSTAD